MGKLIFISGGVRSGKSSLAVKLARKLGRNVVFVATAVAIDEEMRGRIEKHKKERPKNWETLEIVKDLDKIIYAQDKDVILVDCLAVYVSHLMRLAEEEILNHLKNVVRAVEKSKLKVVIVSNEVGCGIVPDNQLGRKYRDILGKANQMFAASANEFYVMFAGVPVNVKCNC